MLQIFYRYCAIENKKPRPSFFSKVNCLKNFLIAFDRIEDAKLTFFSDGPVSPEVLEVLKDKAEIIELPSLGNEKSFIHVLNETLKVDKEDLIYMVEDDYIHTPDSLEKLLECDKENLGDYITLFDDPLRYNLSDDVPADLPIDNALYVSPTHHWRLIESTTFTFAGRAGIIQEDIDIFSKHAIIHTNNSNYVMDRESWRELHGLGDYENNKPRKLIGAIPSLSTHCETTALSPTINWERIINQNV